MDTNDMMNVVGTVVVLGVAAKVADNLFDDNHHHKKSKSKGIQIGRII